jgi:hypothetical protein
MAKKITATEEQDIPGGLNTENTTAVNDSVAENGKAPENRETVEKNGEDKEDKETDVKPEEKPETEKPTETAPENKSESDPQLQSQAQVETPLAGSYPPSVEAILKSFPTYESLYIDSHGGIYTPTTAPVVRGNAVLCKNPYHKSLLSQQF